MVSPLWKASSDGDLNTVLALLNDASAVDIEVKDHTGSSPLIEAVKNGHVEIVRLLLGKGADPLSASSQGRPENFTTDPVILDLLKSAQQKAQAERDAVGENGYAQNPEYVSQPPPPGAYPYYPTINPALSTMGEPAMYYPPPPAEAGNAANGIGHLPPPEIARMIPCRYFPACRYGPQCMFAHPQGPYYQGGNMPPPPQYPPFDPALGPNPYGYYPPMPPPPPQFQQINGGPMTPISPPPQHPVHHARSPSEIVSPSQVPFPNGAPPPPAGPYVPMSPNGYPHPAVPMSGPPIPSMHHQPPPPPGPQSPTAIYHNIHPVPPFPALDGPSQFIPQSQAPAYPEQPDLTKPPVQPEAFAGHHPNRDANGPRRGGMGRRASFVGKKPACIFFPAGRCKNGDDCRFPHVLENHVVPSQVPPFYPPRGGAPRPPRAHHAPNGQATTGLEQKMANVAIRDDAPRVPNGTSEPAPRPRFQQGPKHHANGANGAKKAGTAPRVQRVPSADDFPVLPGSTTPPRVNGTNGTLAGPTAAQVLRAPAPARKDTSEDGRDTANATREPSPEVTRASSPQEIEATEVAGPAPVEQPQPPAPAQKLPVSFAAAAAAAAAASANGTSEATRVAIAA